MLETGCNWMGAALSIWMVTSLTYQWTLITRPEESTATLSEPTLVNPTFLVDQPGTYKVLLIVNDGMLDSGQDTMTVNVANLKPVFELFSNPDDPLLLLSETPDGEIIEYFGDKDREGFATALNTVRVQNAEGDTTRILLDVQGTPISNDNV